MNTHETTPQNQGEVSLDLKTLKQILDEHSPQPVRQLQPPSTYIRKEAAVEAVFEWLIEKRKTMNRCYRCVFLDELLEELGGK